MTGPTGTKPTVNVLHTIAEWGVPSERFVVDLVRSMTLTRPAVVCGNRVAHASTSPLDVPVTQIQPFVDRMPERHRRRVLRGLIAAHALRRRARLLHCHFGNWAAHTAGAAEKLGRPWALSLHGYDVLVLAAREPEQERVQSADLVIVPSQFLAAAAVRHGFPAERVRVIPSGVDVDAYTYRPRGLRADGTVHVAFAGRFVPKKGVIDAARAMAAAQAIHGGLVCTFVGYGRLEDELRAELDRLRLPARILDGRQPGAVRQVIDETDLVLTASRTAPDGDAESLGLVNLEAQLCGVPVVTTRHGGIPEAVSPDGAVLVPEGAIDDMRDALVELARHPDRWPAMGAAGHEHVRANFRLADRVREVEEAYLDLLREDGPRNRP